MRDSSTATVEAPTEPAPKAPDPVACIDLDRFCEECGYNLRTLPVHRDARTGIPVVRCPECGRFQSANELATALRPWLRRATALLLGIWILTVLTVFVFLVMGEGALSFATLEELTIRGGYTTQRINNTTVRTWTTLGALEVNQNVEYYRLFLASMLACSFAIAFLSGLLIVVTFPHWRRAACASVVVGLPIAVGAVMAVAWSQEAPHLFGWGVPYMAGHVCAQLAGGLAGILLGRPFARLVVRIILPPGARPRLAYLWLADRKPLPSP